MNISSRQIFKAITHYQKTNEFEDIDRYPSIKQGVSEHIESLIDAMRTGESNDKVFIEEINGFM